MISSIVKNRFFLGACPFAFFPLLFPVKKIQTAGLYAAIFLRRPQAGAERISAAIPHARFSETEVFS